MIKIIFLVVVLFPFYVLADVVVPSERVQDGINIRAEPSSNSQLLGVLAKGDSAVFVNSIPYWYMIEYKGVIGFVSKSWSTIIPSNFVSTSSYVIDVIDVGTGLSILVQGEDFSLLYDAGSNDDLTTGAENRVLSYLSEQYPALSTIDHLILSHPHRDHVELMPDVIDKYEIKHFWNSGAINDICGYRLLLKKLANEGAQIHDAKFDYGTHEIAFTKDEGICQGQPRIPFSLLLNYDSKIDNQPFNIGKGATAQFLFVDGSNHSSFNDNSLVLMLNLSGKKILFMGDAEAGKREEWENGVPSKHSIEGQLLACCKSFLKADILVAGHHGSMTSSRSYFLDAVNADYFVISSGPTKYNTVILPDPVVVETMKSRGLLFRTDLDDESCGSNINKFGIDADGEAGGCDNIQFSITNSSIEARYVRKN